MSLSSEAFHFKNIILASYILFYQYLNVGKFVAHDPYCNTVDFLWVWPVQFKITALPIFQH